MTVVWQGTAFRFGAEGCMHASVCVSIPVKGYDSQYKVVSMAYLANHNLLGSDVGEPIICMHHNSENIINLLLFLTCMQQYIIC